MRQRRIPDDLRLLQGVWTISSLELDGADASSMLDDAHIDIEGDRFTTRGTGPTYKGRFKLDASSEPPQIDMKFEAGPETGNTNLGIYLLEGDTWQICLATRGKVRPSQFATAAGSGFALETLTRGSPRRTRRATKAASQLAPHSASDGCAPVTELEGEWKMVSGIMDGIAMEDSAVQWVRRSTIGREITVRAGPQLLMKMSFTYDPSQSPKTIDYANTAGVNKGKSQFGIYEFEGELLKICMAAPGSARPAAFRSVLGEKTTFTVWKRIK